MLDLDDTPLEGAPVRSKRPTSLDDEPDLRKPARAQERPEPKSKTRANKRQVIAASALGAILLGAGGWFGYNHFLGGDSQNSVDSSKINQVKTLLEGDTPNHWVQAQQAAQKILQQDKKNADGLAASAIAGYAQALEYGIDGAAHLQKGKNAATALRQAKDKAKSKLAPMAEGLQALADGNAGLAIPALQKGVNRNPQSKKAPLFLAWAQAATHNHQAAVQTLTAALKKHPDHIPALYALASSQLALGKQKEAREAYLAVIKHSREKFQRDHLGAMIGIARLEVADRAGAREKSYMDILGRPDIEKQDPRAVSLAWALAGDEALAAGRLSVASDRYKSALRLDAGNLDALVGQAAISRAQKEYDTARQSLEKVLALDPNNIHALLESVALSIAEERIDKAREDLDTLLSREPPIEHVATRARIMLLKGRALSKQEDALADAEAAFKEAASLAGDGGVAANLELADLYVRQGRAQDALTLLEPLKAMAENDPALAVNIGVAYLGNSDTKTAIEYFQMALTKRPDDVEALFQLGRAQFGAESYEDAFATMKKAAAEAPDREDVPLALADMYERRKKNDEAKKIYDQLTAKEKASLNALGQAGRFYAKIGDIKGADDLATKLLAVDENNAAGHYLKGEAHFARKEYEAARESFIEATRHGVDARYNEALGRAYEMENDYDQALYNYDRAIKDAPTYLAPRMGRARIRVARHEYTLALEELEPAIAIDPGRPEIYFQIGYSYYNMREDKKAVDALKKAVKIDKSHAESWYYLGLSYKNLEKRSDWIRALENATRLADPDNTPWLTDAYRSLGYAYRAKSKNSGAKAAWTRYLDRVEKESNESREVRSLMNEL
jgi:tetratricopeptide (TPR) repeat protein